MESIYSPGFTFAIANNDKTGLSGSSNREASLFNDFITGNGPEFTIFLSNHPYTQALKLQKRIVESQLIIKLGLQDKRINVSSGQFYPWDATLDSPMQFIGSFRYDGYTSGDGTMINNVVYDSKSITSLFYHIPGISNRRRTESKRLGTTYQLYIWQSKK